MSEYTCLQCTQDCHGESARQARTIRRLFTAYFLAKASANRWRKLYQHLHAAMGSMDAKAEDAERARIVAAIRDCVWERVSGPKDVADAIERGVL